MRFRKIILLLILSLLFSSCGGKENNDYVKEGIEYITKEKYDKAEESFLKAIEKNPQSAEGFYGLGGIYNYKERYPDAEKAFKTALKLDPTHHDAHYSLGYTYEMMGKKEEAENEYQRYRDLKKKFDAFSSKDMESR